MRLLDLASFWPPRRIGTSGTAPAWPTITVTGGTITPFSRGGVDYVQIDLTGAASLSVSAPVDAQWAIWGAGPGGSGAQATNRPLPGGGSGAQLVQGTGALAAGQHSFDLPAGGAGVTGAAMGGHGATAVWTLPDAGVLNAAGGRAGGTYFPGSGASDWRGQSGYHGSGGAVTASMAQAAGVSTDDGYDGGAAYWESTAANCASGGGAGAGGPGGDASLRLGGDGGSGILLDWLADPRWVCSGSGGLGSDSNGAPGQGATAGVKAASTRTADAVYGSAAGPACFSGACKTGNGGPAGAVIVIRAAAATVIEAPPPDADFSMVTFTGSSSAEYSGSEFADMMATFGATALLDGDAGARAEQICARLGSHPWALEFPDNTIPASGAVLVTVDGGYPPYSSFLRAFSGTVAGISGTLSWSSEDTSLMFTRAAPGDAVSLSGPTEFISSIADTARRHPAVLWIGKNNLTSGVAPNSGEYVAQMHREVRDWLLPARKRVIVFTQFCNTGTSAGSAVRARIEACNALLRSDGYDGVIEVLDWMRDAETWTRLGLTPTAEDEAQLALGNLPPSLARDTMHLSNAAEADLHTYWTRPAMIAAGWYS